MKKIYIILLLLLSFSLYFINILSHNIFIKIGEYEFVTYFGDKDVYQKLEKIKKYDENKIINKKIIIKFGDYFQVEDSLSNLGAKIENKNNFEKIEFFNYYNPFNYQKDIFYEDFIYQITFDNNKLKKYLENKLNKNKIKLLNIENFYFDKDEGLIGIYSKDINIETEETDKKFYFKILPLQITEKSYNLKEITIPVDNKIEKFYNTYQSKLINLNKDLYFKNKKLFYIKNLGKEPILLTLNKDNFSYYGNIQNNKDKYFYLSGNKLNKTLYDTLEKSPFSYYKKYFSKKIKNNKYLITEKRLLAFPSEVIINDELFSKNKFYLPLTTKTFNKIKTYKKNKELTLDIIDKKIDYKVCQVLNNLGPEQNLTQKIYYYFGKEYNKEINNHLNLITKLLLNFSIEFNNENSTINQIKGYKSTEIRPIIAPIGSFMINYYDLDNYIKINKNNANFLILCNIENNQMKININYNEIPYKNIFGPVNDNGLEKWIIDYGKDNIVKFTEKKEEN